MGSTVILLLALFVASSFSLSCRSTSTVATDNWCNAVCNNNPPYCPSDKCVCGSSSPPSASPAPSNTTLVCTGQTSLVTSTWCNQNCNNNPSFCPSDLCKCTTNSGAPTPTPVAGSSAGKCFALRQPATDTWCNDNCGSGYCPPDFCSCPGSSNGTEYQAIEACRPVFTDAWCQATCSATPNTTQCTTCCRVMAPVAAATPLFIEKPEEHVTDLTDIKLYYSLDRALWSVTVNGVTGAVLSQSLCQNGITGAKGIAIDKNEGVFVADYGSSRLLYVNPVCNGYTVVIPANHYIASPIDVEILEGQGTIIVSSAGRPGIYSLQLDTNFNIISYSNTGATNQFAHGLAQCIDTDGHNGFLFVEQDAFLVFFDIPTQTRTTIISPSFGTVDIKDVEYRPGCGIFFAADDNNKVFQCGVNMNTTQPSTWNSCVPPPTSCVPICNNLIDSTSCKNLISPTGLTLDCLCNTFVSNLGQGALVGFEAFGPSQVFSNTVFGNDLDMVGPNFCQPAPSRSVTPTMSPPSSPSPSPSRTPSPSPTPTPTRSVTVTPTPSPSFSALAIQIFMYNQAGTCSGNCGTASSFKIMQMSVSVEKVDNRIGNGAYLSTDAAFSQCTTAGGRNAAIGSTNDFSCNFQLNMDSQLLAASWNINEFDVYSRTSTAFAKWPPPVFTNAPALTAPNTFPNQNSNTIALTTVAAAVNCTNDWTDFSFRFVWTPTQTPPICTHDASLNRDVCFPSLYTPNSNNIYFNKNNVVQSDQSIYQSFTC